MSGGLLVTGGTGFLGMSLIARLLEAEDGPDIHVLVRSPDRLDAMLRSLYEEVPAAARRLRPVLGDVTHPRLGLSDADRRLLRDEVSEVVHCAASISFTLPLGAAREVNVGGTQRVLELAGELPALRRLVHVSTAYVAGSRRGWFHEHDRDGGVPFRNTYEQSKHEAEAFVFASGLPATVVRPSIVVGESDSGWTPAFNVLYWPLQAFARGLVDELPADPAGVVDVVPVDHVAGVLLAALAEPDPCPVYHATAGASAPDVAGMVELSAATIGVAAPALLPAARDHERHPAGIFAPYLEVGVRFSDACARTQLGLVAPPLEDYFAAIVGYARSARWGKRPLSRERARAQGRAESTSPAW